MEQRMHFFYLKNSFQSVFIFSSFFICHISHLVCCTHNVNHQIAIINKPVVDFFQKIPLDPTIIGVSPELKECPRDHQGIYNEAFCATRRGKHSFTITSPAIKNGNDQEISFKIESEHATLIDSGNPLIKAIPIFNPDKKIITLLYPWGGYSIGTQFVAKASDQFNECYSILIPQFDTHTIREEQIPHIMTTECLPPDNNPKKQFLDCVKKIVKTTRLANYTIPYVWGGSSFVANQNDHPFYLNPDDGNWHLDRVEKTMPYTGFDCSALIWRALHMIKKPLPWRNTGAMSKNYKPVMTYKELQNGDLFWFPGHIVIVADKEKNTIIQAHGYTNGYGKMYKTTLKEFFNEVNSFYELFQYSKSGKPLSLKRNQPCFAETDTIIADWSFLSIE
jgi:hypothetical protein